MNVLILVLSARREPWGSLMNTQMETWDKEDHPQTRTLYYCGKSDQPSTDKVFYSPTLTESLEDVSPRTIEAFEEAINLPWHWDYLARPHSSTYVHKSNLVTFCERNPYGNAVYGIKTGGDKPFLWGGAHYIFSRDVIEKMVAYRRKWNRNIMDDNSLTEMVDMLHVDVWGGHSATINFQPDGSYLTLVYGHGENYTTNNLEDMSKLDGHFFVRCKHDPDRTVDLRIMRELHKNWK